MLAGGYDERLRVQPRTEHPKKIRELWDKRGKHAIIIIGCFSTSLQRLVGVI